ncbi:MAG: chorismate mutase [Oscillospiraceae bacterium]|nr:chorismate mutase [Oscillospiraceae bacterium]
MELKDYRGQIDEIDRELVRLFEARMGLAAEIAAYKRAHDLPILQPEREREKLETLTAQVGDDLKEPLRRLYATVFELSRDHQASALRCGLLGERLAHSYSPQLHAMLGSYGYELFEIAPAQLGDFLQSGGFDALNVTIPYKQRVLPYCAELSETARRIGSVNTILRRADGTLYGDNTDYDGFLWLLERNGGVRPGAHAIVLGDGGASKTVQTVLRRLGAQVTVLSRRGEHSFDTLKEHADAVLLVNATPVGMYPNNAERLIELADLPDCRCVLDLVYNPARTRLLLDAEERGIRCENGLAMLVGQAARAAELFTRTIIPDSRREEILCKLNGQMQNLVLIGMPGCGKSAVGRLLADRLRRPFYDADTEIERELGCDIPTFFAQHGEDAFRKAETKVLERLGKESGCVIATGGGCVTREENYPLLHQNGKIVWLRRPLDRLPTDGRPISQSVDLTALYAARQPLYERFCDFAADNCGMPEETVETILQGGTR